MADTQFILGVDLDGVVAADARRVPAVHPLDPGVGGRDGADLGVAPLAFVESDLHALHAAIGGTGQRAGHRGRVAKEI